MANRIATNQGSFRRSRGGVRRATNWIASADPTAPTAIAAATAILHQSFTGVQLAGLAPAGGTIVRTRGTLWCRSDQVTASEDPIGAFGMMIVKDTARAIGITALPKPATDSPDDDFFLWTPWQASLTFVQQDATGVQIFDRMRRFDFDSKAQRKFTTDDALVVTMENISASAGAAFYTLFRILIKPGASA